MQPGIKLTSNYRHSNEYKRTRTSKKTTTAFLSKELKEETLHEEMKRRIVTIIAL